MRSSWGFPPADGQPLRCDAHRHGKALWCERALRPFQTIPSQPVRLDFAPRCLSCEPRPILTMATRGGGSMIARLSAGQHVYLFARWHAWPDGQKTAWPVACLPVCMSGSLPTIARRRIGRARAWRASTTQSKRSNAARGGPPRRRRPIGRPLSSSVTARAVCTTKPPSAESRPASALPQMAHPIGRRTAQHSGTPPSRGRPGPIL